MNKIIAVSFAFVLSLLMGCSSVKVTVEQDRSYNFAGARTYQWIDPPADVMEAEATFKDKTIQTVLNNELAARNMQQVLGSSSADVQVACYVTLSEVEKTMSTAKDSVDAISGGVVLNDQSGRWVHKKHDPELNVYTSEIATITLLVQETRSGNKVWTGSLATELDRSTPLEEQKEQLRGIAHKLMQPFPRALK